MFLNLFMYMLVYYFHIFPYYFSSTGLDTGLYRLLNADNLFQSVTLLPPRGAIVTKIFICFPWQGSMTSLQAKLYRNRGNACVTHSQTREYSNHRIPSFPF
jgi:hypothetical protein